MASTPERRPPPILDIFGFVLKGEVRAANGARVAMSVRIPRLRMRTGEVTAIVGGSGCGKSVLLSLVMGYPAFGLGNRAECADFTLFGEHMPENAFSSVSAAAEWRRTIRGSGGLFYLPQTFPVAKTQQIKVETAMSQIVRAMAAPIPVSSADVRRRITETFKSRGLEASLSKNLDDLSGGERRRAELLARLVAMKSSRRPALLILDEPTTGFDPANALRFIRDVRDVIDELLEDGVEAAALFTTHEMTCLDDRDSKSGRRTVDRVCVVNRDANGHGKGDCTLVFDGPADAVWLRFAPNEDGECRFASNGLSLFEALPTKKSAEWAAEWVAELRRQED